MSGVLTLKMQLTPMQYSDHHNEQELDARAVFEKGRAFPIKFGTESALGSPLHRFLTKYARLEGHSIHFARGNWIAVDNRIILKGSIKKSEIFIASTKKIAGRQHDAVAPTFTFTHKDPRVGRIALAGVHYPTKGREKNDPNNDINELYAEKVAKWMRNASSRNALSFIAGDFNMIDALPRQDWAFGHEFTSIADQLRRHQNTGHGAIDGFCSYDFESRVTPKYFKVLDDSQLKMHTDHYVSRCAWTVKHKK